MEKEKSIEWKISDEPVAYEEAIKSMEERVDNVIKGASNELVWLLEHPPLYTAGTSAKESDLVDKDKFPVYETGRGGEYTYHGPDQRVAYVILNLKDRSESPDLKQYVYQLEEWIINSLARIGIEGERREGRVGIWVKDGNSESKIAAIGIRIRKWVTYHGISLNVSPDLEHFKGIVPCGIKGYGVTSIEKMGKHISIEEMDKILKEEFLKIFG